MLRQNFLALWEKLAMLSNVPFDTLNQISSVQEGIRQIQQDAMREKQIAGAAAIKDTGTFFKDVSSGMKTQREIGNAA